MIYFLSVEKVAGLSLGLTEASEVCRRYQEQRLPHISTSLHSFYNALLLSCFAGKGM